MKIFDIVNGKVVMNPQTLVMPEFRCLWDRDKSKEKYKAILEISYIVFLCDESISNPYRAYRENDRVSLRFSWSSLSKYWEADKEIKAAIKKFKQVTQTTNTRLLIKAKSGAEKLADYFNDVDFTVKDKDGKPSYSARELASNLAAVGSIVKSLNQLEEMVKKEQLESQTVRGGGDIGFYEVPRSDFDYGDK